MRMPGSPKVLKNITSRCSCSLGGLHIRKYWSPKAKAVRQVCNTCLLLQGWTVQVPVRANSDLRIRRPPKPHVAHGVAHGFQGDLKTRCPVTDLSLPGMTCPKVLKKLRLSCGLGGSGIQKYWKTWGFPRVWALRCPKVPKNHRFYCGLGGSDVRTYWKTLGFLVVWEAPMSQSIEKP